MGPGKTFGYSGDPDILLVLTPSVNQQELSRPTSTWLDPQTS